MVTLTRKNKEEVQARVDDEVPPVNAGEAHWSNFGDLQ
jgi:hypothetical protein